MTESLSIVGPTMGPMSRVVTVSMVELSGLVRFTHRWLTVVRPSINKEVTSSKVLHPRMAMCTQQMGTQMGTPVGNPLVGTELVGTQLVGTQ